MKDRIKFLEWNINECLWLYNHFKDDVWLKDVDEMKKELIQLKYIDTWI